MATANNATLAQTRRNISQHSFDTSKYVVMNMTVRRDAKTGRLVKQQPEAKGIRKKGK